MLNVRWFRIIAFVEAISYLVLIAAAIAKRGFDLAGFVPIVGPVHGVIFLAYFGFAIALRTELGWNVRTTIVVVFAAIVPLGGFYVEQKILPPAPTQIA